MQNTALRNGTVIGGAMHRRPTQRLAATDVLRGQSRKGQASTEILVLIGMFLLLLLPLLFFAYGRANVTGEDLSVQKAEFAASRLSTAADSVGYLGGKAGIVEEIEVPQNVISLAANSTDIVFDMDVSGGRKQIVKSSAFTLRAVGFERIRRSGTYFFEITAISSYANESTEEVQIKVK